MDFSSRNPATSNALNLAARTNDVGNVKRLLRKINPNCVDNRGWTCLHEAAHNDSYKSMILILKNHHCRPLVETHEGHTALYLACRNQCSLKTIRALLDTVDDIANYGSTEGVTPLHIAASQGRVELIELLLEYGAMIDVQDFDGDTPLNDAVLEMENDAVITLLHAGADPEIKNESGLSSFHLACCKGYFPNVESLFPFITDINAVVLSGDSPLTLAVQGFNDHIVYFLLDNKADPNIMNNYGEMAVDIAITNGCSSEVFKILLSVTDRNKLNKSIIVKACKPHYFKFEILEILLTSDLGPEFFCFSEPFDKFFNQSRFITSFHSNAPLNSYLNICGYIYSQSPEKFEEFFYLFLMRGVNVNAVDYYECPPLAYAHYVNTSCFDKVFQILVEHGCNVDCSLSFVHSECSIPLVFNISMTMYPASIPIVIPYSLYCEPSQFLHVAYDTGQLNMVPQQTQEQLLTMIDRDFLHISAESLEYFVPRLKHLCRFRIRGLLRKSVVPIKTTKEFLSVISGLPVPMMVKNYLRYKCD